MESKDRINFLLVDDQQLILNLAARILKNNGYKNIIYAKNGKDALFKIRKQAVNFVITDWAMPQMTGIELLIIIRNDPKFFDMPVIMVSEEMSSEKILYAVEEGVDAYQEKPFTEKGLIANVNDVLKQKMNPDPMKYKIQKLYALKVQEKYEQAIKLAKDLLKQAQNIDIFYFLCECYLGNNDFEEAKEAIREALKIEETSKAYHMLGKVFLKEGEQETAIEHFEKAYMVNPMNTECIIDMGNAYLQLGKFKEASETFGSMQDTDLTELNSTNIGAAYLGSGDVEKAGKFLQNVNSPILETVAVFNKYAIELRRTGRFEEAIEQYKRCLRIDPSNHILHLNIALSYTEVKNYKEADKSLRACLEIDPNFESAKKLFNFVSTKL